MKKRFLYTIFAHYLDLKRVSCKDDFKSWVIFIILSLRYLLLKT